MKRAAAVLTALALSAPLAACGGGGTDDLAPSASSSTTSAAPEPTASPAASATAETASAAPEPTPDGDDFPAAPALSEQASSGGPLSVTAIRVARQDGYDRVVFELAGQDAGQAGWRVEYVDEPSQPGSGDPVELAGDAALSIVITGTGYPMDTGQEEVADEPALPDDLQVVQDLSFGGVYEGESQAYLGTSGERPFRVFRLGDPERLVVDVSSG